jgi:hypothetical protein
MSDTNNKAHDVLSRPTPKDRVKFRVGFKTQDGSSSCMLAYVDARYVQDAFDEAVGSENWDNNYESIDGKMFCNITVRFPDGSVATKSDCGVETDVEKEKGQASDAFKRAAVLFGVGRDLYGYPDYWAENNSNGYPPKNWTPPGWGADEDNASKKANEPNKASSSISTTKDNPQPEPLKDAPLFEEEEKPGLQEYADQVVQKSMEKAPDTLETPKNSPIESQSPPPRNDDGLRTDTPPDKEILKIEHLVKIAETDKSWILIPQKHEDKKGDKNFTGQFWVPKSQVPNGLTMTSSGNSPVDNVPREIYKANIPRWICEQLVNGKERFIENDTPF